MLKSVHRAKYVLAEPDLLLANAAVHISDPGRISRVEPWHDPPAVPMIEVTDWGSAVIIPGLINAHAHLELTALHGQLTAFTSFTDWISQLIDRRQQWTREHFLNSALRAGFQAAGQQSHHKRIWRQRREAEEQTRLLFTQSQS